MPQPVAKKATYEDLLALPDHVIGEILGGELIVTPRPSRKHAKAAFALSGELAPPYDFGRGGPGGWILLVEPEVRIGEHTVVPDLAGWRKERFPSEEDHNWISAVPDWVCEILSPHTIRTDRVRKMGIYREHAVPHAWLLDPGNKTLEVFALRDGAWVVLGFYAEDDRVRAEPFPEVEIDMGNFWLE
ncbi:MAG: Uma2 family endonuclease [Thermodesulfobacteriota bacterium]|jgi:Uma2 family endonuclease